MSTSLLCYGHAYLGSLAGCGKTAISGEIGNCQYAEFQASRR
jgi:hypothetical protein